MTDRRESRLAVPSKSTRIMLVIPTAVAETKPTTKGLSPRPFNFLKDVPRPTPAMAVARA